MGKGRERRRTKARRDRKRELAQEQAALRKAKEGTCKDETTTTGNETSGAAS